MKWTISWAAANNTSLIWSIVPSSLVNTAGWEHHAVHAAFWKCHLRGPHGWRRLCGLAVWTPCWPKDPHSWPPYTPMSFLSFLRHLKKKKWGWLIDTHTFVIFNIPSLCSEEALVLAHSNDSRCLREGRWEREQHRKMRAHGTTRKWLETCRQGIVVTTATLPLPPIMNWFYYRMMSWLVHTYLFTKILQSLSVALCLSTQVPRSPLASAVVVVCVRLCKALLPSLRNPGYLTTPHSLTTSKHRLTRLTG